MRRAVKNWRGPKASKQSRLFLSGILCWIAEPVTVSIVYVVPVSSYLSFSRYTPYVPSICFIGQTIPTVLSVCRSGVGGSADSSAVRFPLVLTRVQLGQKTTQKAGRCSFQPPIIV